jgi:hypothetical protein
MPKINSSSVKICEVLKKFSESSQKVLAQKFSIVTRAVVSNKTRKEVVSSLPERVAESE